MGPMMDAWVAIDFETANARRGSPCSVAMVRFENGEAIEMFETLIKPPDAFAWFEPFNTMIHGITETDVTDAPPWREVAAQMREFIGTSPIVAHNAAFDTGVIREANTAVDLPWPNLRYACTLVLARPTWPELVSYSLPFVAEAAGAPIGDHHHKAEADARASANILLAAQRRFRVDTIDALMNAADVGWGEIAPDAWQGCRRVRQRQYAVCERFPDANPEASPIGSFFGKRVCFTGKLHSMTRREAAERLAKVGGQAVPNVTKNTDILVQGVQDPRYFGPNQTKSGKQKAAESLKAAGSAIEMIGEVDFLRGLETNE